MIIDPSRVLLLGEYATLAESGSETELGAREAEVRVFIEALWSAAGGGGRRRFMEAVGPRSSAMPWVAVKAREPGEGGEGLAPPAIELLMDSEPMGDEGVAAHLLDPETEAAELSLKALREWDWEVLGRVLTPSGWRLEIIDEDSPEGTASVGDEDAKNEGEGEGEGEVVDDPEPAANNSDEQESGGALVFPESVTVTRQWWPWALAAGGIGIVGTALWLVVERKE